MYMLVCIVTEASGGCVVEVYPGGLRNAILPLKPMRSRLWQPLLCACLLFVAFLPAFGAGDAEHGKYLVEQMAMCGDCHTPMGPTGPELDKSLKGSVLTFGPLQPMKQWHTTAPDITSSSKLFQKWGEAGLTKFLETGLGPSGHAAAPPMPPYKLKANDAEDIVAYLKTLK